MSASSPTSSSSSPSPIDVARMQHFLRHQHHQQQLLLAQQQQQQHHHQQQQHARAVTTASAGINNNIMDFASPTSSSSSDEKCSPGETPMSRTNQYKKIMKPLLERKRRARINKCLDELKDIMTVALQAQGENVSKLEKADILELTVRHLHRLQQAQRLSFFVGAKGGGTGGVSPVVPAVEEAQRFQSGYSSCAQEATTFLLKSPGVDVRVSQRLVSHLGSNMTNPFATPPAAASRAAGFMQMPPQAQAQQMQQQQLLLLQLQQQQQQQQRLSGGFHSPPLPASTGQDSVTPPPRPCSNPAMSSPTASTFGRLTVSITKAPLSADLPMLASPASPLAGKMPIKPAPIRLNPGDRMWRPF